MLYLYVLYVWYTESLWFYTHYIQQRDRELKKMAAMRAHNIGFYKPSHWHG